VSYSWVDPHFAALYARREEERLAERLATRMRDRAALEPCSSTRARSRSAAADSDSANTPEVSLRSGEWPAEVMDEIVRGRHLKLL
jgi:hypothetical protein